MRRPSEILFRLRQELANLRMLALPPRCDVSAPAPGGLPPLDDPVVALLRGTPFAREVESIAGEILRHRFPLLGLTLETGPEIEWRRDYLHGISSGLSYFRRIPYLDFARVGDHKIVWEMSRHQHLVLLAQAGRLTGAPEFFDEIPRQLESWLEQNPFLRGINWTSALEVAFRALSWMWIDRLAGTRFRPEFRRRFLTALYRHGRYLAHNLSIYFSPNTHLLGEAVALHALAVLYPDLPGAARWARDAGRVVIEQMRAQVRPDGTHFEQSTYYHVYALDMFLFHALVAANPPSEYLEGLRRMADYLWYLLGPAGAIPFIGDDDGGRFFHPYGERDQFGRATLATCAAYLGGPWPCRREDLWEQGLWWMGERALATARDAAAPPPGSRLFPDAGIAVMDGGSLRVIAKAGPFGEGSAGHSHADVLSFVCRRGGEEILIDPGAYTYVADPAWRQRFRETAAHNTVRIDGLDQATPAGPFRWSGKPRTEIREWSSDEHRDYLDAACRYAGFLHRRRWLLLKPGWLFVLDEIDGPPGEHTVEQFWHLGGRREYLALSGDTREIEGWRSRALFSKEPAPVLCASRRGKFPLFLAAVVDASAGALGPVEVREEGGAVIVCASGRRVRFPAADVPAVF